MTALARIVMLLVALGATGAFAADIGYLSPPGVPATAFPSPQRPFAPIVSPRRSSEEHRDRLNKAADIAGLLELTPCTAVGAICARSGCITLRLSPLVG